jgi:hypothetical protein
LNKYKEKIYCKCFECGKRIEKGSAKILLENQYCGEECIKEYIEANKEALYEYLEDDIENEDEDKFEESEEMVINDEEKRDELQDYYDPMTDL